MRLWGTMTAFAALALPMAAMGQTPPDAAAMKRLEAKVPPQSWYPDGYYDVRIAAEAQMAEFPRDRVNVVIDSMDAEGRNIKAYDVMDCSAEYFEPADVDPMTARYGDVAVEISRMRSELDRLKYPLAAYAAPLLAYERMRVEEARNAPDPMLPEPVEGAEVAEPSPEPPFAESEYDPARDPLYVLAQTIEANRQRLAPKLPHVVLEGGCGAGEGDPVIVRTVPPGGEVLLVNAFAFKVCTRRQPDPWDRFACKWNEIETGVERSLSGRYVYQIRWPDGTLRKGTREIVPDFGGVTATTVTFRRTGS